MASQPLAEVFGYPISNMSGEARRHRQDRLCPFNNRVPSCTKDKIEDPLGVCSVFSGTNPVITCPVRFREGWSIASDAAAFFFAPGTVWTSLSEVRLRDKNGNPVGNIDLVLVSYNAAGQLTDFGALEVQAVYISGNVRRPFEYYMQDSVGHQDMQWTGSVRPDFLSSSRKRLAPQLISKGGIINAWGKKLAVAVDSSFFDTLPSLTHVPADQAEMAWFVYRLELNQQTNQYHLVLSETVYTMYAPTLAMIAQAEPAPLDAFVSQLQTRLDQMIVRSLPPDSTPTSTPTDSAEPL